MIDPDDEPDEEPGPEETYGHDDDGRESVVTIEITGLSIYTHHGVTDEEQKVGQRLVFDITLDVGDCDATVTDRVEDTIDYGAVCEAVALVASRSRRTLERLVADVADHLIDQFGAHGVRVKAIKPEPPIALSVDEVAVELWRE